MRSRYTAYALADVDYLLSSWHASTRPPPAQLRGHATPNWVGLQLLGNWPGEDVDEAFVEFEARYREAGHLVTLHEVSRFRREAGRWYYLDGTSSSPRGQASRTPARNAACPCGSGKKYKRCCGK